MHESDIDIEDLAFDVKPASGRDTLRYSCVTPAVTSIEPKKQSKYGLECDSDSEDILKGDESEALKEQNKGLMPGTGRVWLKTFGCSHNASDSEFMAGQLQEYGYTVSIDETSADNCDVWVVNSCTVKGPSQAAVDNLVKKAKSQNIPIVVAGCVPQGERSAKIFKDVSLLGVAQIDRIVEAVEETIRGNTVKLLARNRLPRLDLVGSSSICCHFPVLNTLSVPFSPFDICSVLYEDSDISTRKSTNM